MGRGHMPASLTQTRREGTNVFSEHAKNYWKCFSASCNETAGCKGGDTINFVALMDGSSQLAAAKKLAEWFGIAETKTPQHIAEASKEKPKTEMQSSNQNPSTSGDSVKYMASVDGWFDEVSVRLPDESEEEHRRRVLKGLKAKLIESYRAGQKAR
jgi:hypothetical protein